VFSLPLHEKSFIAAVNDRLGVKGVKCLQVNLHHQSKTGDRRLTKDGSLTCVSAGRAIFAPFDF